MCLVQLNNLLKHNTKPHEINKLTTHKNHHFLYRKSCSTPKTWQLEFLPNDYSIELRFVKQLDITDSLRLRILEIVIYHKTMTDPLHYIVCWCIAELVT